MSKDFFESTSDDKVEEELDEEAEVVETDPEVFKKKEKPLFEAFKAPTPPVEEPKFIKPKGLDDSKYIFHPEDGSVSFRVDEHGCQRGYVWDEELGRCVPKK